MSPRAVSLEDLAKARAALEERSAGAARRRAALAATARGAEDERAARHKLWRDAREGERIAARALHEALSSWIGARTPEEDVARLDPSYPILLLPVRLETRFGARNGAPELRVRVYPDEIFADTHEPALTDVERALGERYWTDGWSVNAEAGAWRALVARLPAARAAWVVRATTPTNVARRLAEAPAFPAPDSREGAWTRAARAGALPDRWLVLCFRDDVEVRRGVGGPIAEPLALTLSPSADANDPADVVDLSGDGLVVDRDMLWTVDFDEAVRVGMGLRIPLDDADVQKGFDRILAIGVKSSLAPKEAEKTLEALLDAHHFGRGFALVAQGTATNNAVGAPSGYPPPDPEGAVSFAVERRAPLTADGSDGSAFAAALGVPRRLLDHVAGAERLEQVSARAMSTLLWPVTWGYFLEQIAGESPALDALGEVERHVEDYVRGRGPLPLFRVGGTPYGVLPVGSLARWAEGDGAADRKAGGLSGRLPALLLALRKLWLAHVPEVPRVGGSGDPDRDLLDVLAMDASAREVRIRSAFGPDFQANLAGFLGADTKRWDERKGRVADDILAILGDAGRGKRGFELLFEDEPTLFGHPLVARPLSEDLPLDFNWLRWLRTAPPRDVRREAFPPGVARPTALLYLMARHALLSRYGKAALDLTDRVSTGATVDRKEHELVGIVAGTEARPTVWQRLESPLPEVTRDLSMGDFLFAATSAHRAAKAGRTVRSGEDVRAGLSITIGDTLEPIAGLIESLEVLEALPTAELDRLFGETLDCASHRLDAWITSLATERLASMRRARPSGIHLAAFGWVEDLAADREARVRLVDRGRGPARRVQVESGGFIHAPSMDHASAGAVLRNAYLTRRGAERERYALDLSSARVRTARWLLACVREGQSIAALLGYRFERGLHEGHPGIPLDRFIEPIRALYPLPAVREVTRPDPAESLSPRDVVNGLAVRDAWRAGTIPFGAGNLVVDAGQRAAIEAELRALDEAVDAVADVLTADAVYHLVRGTTAGAAASLDSLAKGVRPPDPEVTRVPRGGTALTHRVAVVLGGAEPAAPGWDAIPDTPRAAAEPRLDRWAGRLLGRPDTIRCRVRVAAPTAADPDRRVAGEVTMDQLGLHPVDLLALVAGMGSAGTSSEVGPHGEGAARKGAELERRIAAAALAGAPQRGPIEISYERDPAWNAGTRSLGEFLEMARAINAVVAGARPLSPADLVTPEHVSDMAGADAMTAESDARAAAAAAEVDATRTALDAAVAALPVVAPGDPEPDLAPIRAALVRASSLGIAGAFPALPETTLDGAKALVDARVAAAAAPGAGAAELAALRDALRRAAALGSAVEPRSVTAANSAATLAETVAVAVTVSTELPERSASARRALRESTVALAGSVSAELKRRVDAAAAAPAAAEKMQAAFGREFVFLPRFRPGNAGELQAAIDFDPVLVPDARAKREWIAQAERVRAPLSRWRRLELYAGCLGTAPPAFEVAQLPFVDPARWVALPFAREADRPPAGRVSVALYRVARPAAAAPWAGLLLDEWAETIPSAAETTGVAFHYDDPGAEAAQALLLAVPPPGARRWDLPTLVDILTETLALAKIRAVDAELVGELGQLVPAAYLAANDAGDTVSTDFGHARARAPMMVYRER